MKEFEQKVKDGEEKAASLGPELVEKVLECAKLKEAKNKKATAVEHLNEAAKGTYSETGSETLGELMRRGVIPAAGTLLENKDTDKGAGIVPMAAKELISIQKMLSVKTRIVRFPNPLRQLGKHWPYLPRKQM